MLLAQGFYSKLREHLAPRVQAALQKEAASLELSRVGTAPEAACPLDLHNVTGNGVFFKGDCIYQHKLIRFNFTTYDMRRGTDIVNPGTSRCNIMLIAGRADGSDHHFLYARVLGAYHVNVISPGARVPDYKARSFNFLWV